MSDLALPKPQKRKPKPRKRIERTSSPRRARKARPGRITIAQLDDLARPLCHERKTGCEAASYLMHGPTKGCSNLFDWAHILSRTYKTAIRWHPDNCLKLCKGHHMFFTPRPIEWRRFLLFKIGEANLMRLEEQALRELRARSDREMVRYSLLAYTHDGESFANRLVINP